MYFILMAHLTLKQLHFKCSGALSGCCSERHRSELSSSSSLLTCRRGTVIRKPARLPGGGRRWRRGGAQEVEMTTFWGIGWGGRRAARASLRALSRVTFLRQGRRAGEGRVCFGWWPPCDGELQLHRGDLKFAVLSSLLGGDACRLSCPCVRSAEVVVLGSRSWT